MTLTKHLSCALAAAAFMTTSVSAIPLLPGGNVSLPGTTLVETPALGGTVLDTASNLMDANPAPVFVQGYGIDSEIRRSDGTGTTIISHQFASANNNFPSFVLIDSMSLTGYVGFETDLYFRTDASGDRAPSSVERSADGDVLDFIFGFPLVGGYLFQQTHEISFPIEILTDANSFENTGRMTVSGRLLGAETTQFQVTLSGLPVPLQAPPTVPLPAGVPLLGTACAILALASRRPGKPARP